MTTLFISDLHLSDKRADLRELFLRFLRERAVHAQALYVLGDLFEVWLGDDLVLPDYTPVIEAFRALTKSGTAVYVMHGNRDFLLGEEFEHQSGCQLLAEGSIINLYGRRALLLHGDSLCTDDLPYQQMRAQLRNPEFIRSFLAKTPQERIAFAQQLRARSQEETRQKNEYIMDVNAEALANAYRTHGVDLLIHGHTHRLGHHTITVDDHKVERFVLGDWDRVGSVLVADAQGMRMEPVN